MRVWREAALERSKTFDFAVNDMTAMLWSPASTPMGSASQQQTMTIPTNMPAPSSQSETRTHRDTSGVGIPDSDHREDSHRSSRFITAQKKRKTRGGANHRKRFGYTKSSNTLELEYPTARAFMEMHGIPQKSENFSVIERRLLRFLMESLNSDTRKVQILWKYYVALQESDPTNPVLRSIRPKSAEDLSQKWAQMTAFQSALQYGLLSKRMPLQPIRAAATRMEEILSVANNVAAQASVVTVINVSGGNPVITVTASPTVHSHISVASSSSFSAVAPNFQSVSDQMVSSDLDRSAVALSSIVPPGSDKSSGAAPTGQTGPVSTEITADSSSASISRKTARTYVPTFTADEDSQLRQLVTAHTVDGRIQMRNVQQEWQTLFDSGVTNLKPRTYIQLRNRWDYIQTAALRPEKKPRLRTESEQASSSLIPARVQAEQPSISISTPVLASEPTRPSIVSMSGFARKIRALEESREALADRRLVFLTSDEAIRHDEALKASSVMPELKEAEPKLQFTTDENRLLKQLIAMYRKNSSRGKPVQLICSVWKRAL